jgi:hypothetical protein
MEENKLINIENLEIGDEVLIGLNSNLKYLKILEKPRLSKKRIHWRTKQLLYINVKCSSNETEIVTNWTDFRGNTRTYMTKQHNCTPENHNRVYKQDLNERLIWLIKRNNNN